MRERKLGLFGNAKYSRPVFKNVSNAVVKGVEKDIALLVRHEPSNVVRKWANAPCASGDADSSVTNSIAAPAVSFKPVSSRRAIFRKESNAIFPSHILNNSPALHTDLLAVNHGSTDSQRYLQELLSEGPDIKRRRLESSQIQMPETPPLENIAINVLSACPKITLRDSNTLRYGEQVLSLAQSGLTAQINKTLYSNNTEVIKTNVNNSRTSIQTNSVIATARASQANNFNSNKNAELFKTLCNKTAIFDDDSDAFDDSDALDTESPTRLFNASSINNKEYAGDVTTNNKDSAGDVTNKNFFDMSAFDTPLSAFDAQSEVDMHESEADESEFHIENHSFVQHIQQSNASWQNSTQELSKNLFSF